MIILGDEIPLPAMRVKWSEQEENALRAMYPDMRTDDIARILGRKLQPTYRKAAQLGLRKSDAYNASSLSGRIVKGFTPYGKRSRFPKGHVPWNTGTHFTAGGRSAETRFREGQSPHNTLPIGSHRVTKDGTLQRKISNAKGNNSKRWRGVHELVWIEVHGPVPAAHIVVFKSGMRTAQLEHITIDRVECISLAENMRRNSFHRYPQPIPKLIQLRGALQRQINLRACHEK